MSDALMAPSPFLRWAGGKRRLAASIANYFPTDFNPSKHRFFEPFVGGGAVSFYLGSSESRIFVPGTQLYLNDSNYDLIAAYIQIRDNLENLLSELDALSNDTSKVMFEKIRAQVPKTETKRAARFIYLNKTCFNGLWRVNSKGEFNVPWGKLKNPKIFDENNLRSVNKRLQNSKITNQSYVSAVAIAKKGDLVYLDPPYIPLTSTSNFSKYAKEDFGILDQYALAGVIRGLTERGVRVILSNSDTSETKRIFGSGMNLTKISAGRSISAKASSRGIVSEIIGINFSLDSKFMSGNGKSLNR